jgi:Acyltransferase C-terminus
MTTLWDILRRKFPRKVYIRMKRYSMGEVIQDSNWLCKAWAEKDRLLSHFTRHGQFPVDNRGYSQHRIFDTRTFALETSIASFIRLFLVPFAVPILLLLSVPLFWTLLTIWLCQKAYNMIYNVPVQAPVYHPYEYDDDGHPNPMMGGTEERTPGSTSSTTGTPYFPATPFASPSILNWRDMFTPNDNTRNHDNNNNNNNNNNSRPSR